MSILSQLKRHEGWRERPYLDTEGIGTFGYGFTYLTKEEGEIILRNRIQAAIEDLTRAYPWAGGLDAGRFNVLVNMTYNMGIKRLGTFVNTLQAIKDGRFNLAADNMLNSKWAGQVHDRAIELAEQMRTGVEL